MITKEGFFKKSFAEKCRTISVVRQTLYEANTKEERDAAIPPWIIEMVKGFEKEYKFINFTSLFLGSFLMMKSYEDNEEVVYVLIEIYTNQLHLTIIKLDQLVGLSWSKSTKEDDSH